MSVKIWRFPSLAMISRGNAFIGSILYPIAFEEFYKIGFLTLRNINPKSLKDSVVE